MLSQPCARYYMAVIVILDVEIFSKPREALRILAVGRKLRDNTSDCDLSELLQAL